jgi:HEAT repeat protein
MRRQILLTLCLTGALWLTLSLPMSGAPETTQELVGILESDASVQEKAIACRKLGEFGTRDAVPALASLLDHEVLGAYARSGLERIPDPSASAALRSALETTEGDLLVGVITSLGALRDEKAVGALSELTGHADPTVSRAALLALGRVASPDAVRTVKTALASGREGAAAACLLAAEQQRAQGQTDVAIALYDAVLSVDAPRTSHLGAMRGAIVTRNSVPFLMEQLKSDDAAIRDVALLTIREMPSDALADALHAQLAAAAPDLRVQLITALGDCHNPASFQVVRSQLDSDTQAIRIAALDVVSTVGRGSELAATLLDVVRDRRSQGERQTAIDLLTHMEGGNEVDRVILSRLGHAETVVFRVDVIRVLGNRRTASAVGDLLEQSRDEDPGVRVAALRAMRRLVGPREVAALIALIKAEQDDAVRTAAVLSLISACGHDGPSGELVLAELKQASDASERDVWTRVLTAVGYAKALPTVLEGLEDEDQEVVAGTITHLSRWPDPAPIETLFATMENSADSEVRRRACSAVIQLTTTAADRHRRPDDVLVEWFGRANAGVETIEAKRQLISGLARVHTLDSFRLLEPYLEDLEVRGEALYAMLSIGSPLVKAGQHTAVKKALPEDSAIEDQDLRWRIGRLRQQVEAAELPE